MTNEEKIMLRELYTSANADQRLILEKICPELKEESEDERIRKWCISHFRECFRVISNNVEYQEYLKNKVIPWLEKQGEHQSIINVPSREIILSIWDLGNEWKELTGGCISTEHGTQLDYIQKHWHESEYYLREKQNEQTSADKIEPKFHEGDWVVRGDTIAQILDIQEQYYVGLDTDGKDFTSSRYLSDDKTHLWTINDAKDGDVLATKDGNPFIFKDCSDADHPNAPVAYCGVNDANNFTISADNHWWEDSNQVCPATREQRVLLFQKMKEAGYKWENNQLEEINGDKNFVDLGLPSGTLWAKCNLGAEKETDFGKFYQWGDTQGYEGVDEHQFNWDDYKWGTSSSCLSKYNNTDGKLVLDNEDDPIFVASNGEFKMPTKEQLQELINCTNHGWTSIDGVNGMKFINKKDDTKYIFIPATGYWWDGSLFGAGSWGLVWSASRNGSNVDDAWDMSFGADGAYMSNFGRCIGFSVRGVLNK